MTPPSWYQKNGGCDNKWCDNSQYKYDFSLSNDRLFAQMDFRTSLLLVRLIDVYEYLPLPNNLGHVA